MGLDAGRREIFLPTAEMEPAAAGQRPRMKPGSFELVVVGQKQESVSNREKINEAGLKLHRWPRCPRRVAVWEARRGLSRFYGPPRGWESCVFGKNFKCC